MAHSAGGRRRTVRGFSTTSTTVAADPADQSAVGGCHSADPEAVKALKVTVVCCVTILCVRSIISVKTDLNKFGLYLSVTGMYLWCFSVPCTSTGGGAT